MSSVQTNGNGNKMVRLTEKQLEVKADFIRDYMGSSNAATSSKFDANANVSKKNIATLSAEINKDINIQINRHMMKQKIVELFGREFADEYIRQLETHELYAHDETNLAPYTYAAQESLVVAVTDTEKQNEKILLTSLEKLYDLVAAPEILVDEDKDVTIKIPKQQIRVLDKKGWTKITQLTKKRRHRDLCVVKTQFGEDVIVTDDHPMIVKNNVNATVEASKSEGMQQWRCNMTDLLAASHLFERTEVDLSEIELGIAVDVFDEYLISAEYGYKKDVIKRKITLSQDLGYVIGFFIAEGYYDKYRGAVTDAGIFHEAVIVQNDKKVLKDLAHKLFVATGIGGFISQDGNKHSLRIGNRLFVAFLKNFMGICDYAKYKNLPSEILTFNKLFVLGIVGGIVDGDGTIRQDTGGFNVRVSSRQMISQLSCVLQLLGYNPIMRYDDPKHNANDLIQHQMPMFGISCATLKKDIPSYKIASCKVDSKFSKYEMDCWATINKVKKIENQYFLNENQYIYDISTESQSFVLNNLWVHNCVSITMYPFLRNGLKDLGGESSYPKHADSFAGSFVNLVFAVSSQFSGAVATGEWLMCLDYYLRKDYGDDYLNTHGKKVANSLQHMVYALNQPAAARGYQSAFWNISIFDQHYFESLFENFIFPLNDKEDEELFSRNPGVFKPNWETLSKLQEFFMHWFNKERTKALLTFPVVTAAMLIDPETKKPRDARFADMLAQEMSEGNSFFIYSSDKADSLSSCCFYKDQKVLTKSSNGVLLSTFEEMDNMKYNDVKKNFTIFHNGSWVKGKSIKLPNRQMYKIVTANNKEFVVSDNHINPTLLGDKKTEDLTTNDYLLFNTNKLDSYYEKDLNLTYDQGVVIGAFLGDGSYGGRVKLADGTVKIYETSFSLNACCFSILKEHIDRANKQFGSDTELKHRIRGNLYACRISSQQLVNFIKTWTQGHKAEKKSLNMNCLLQSYEFRKGILDGWYLTDGGNSNRCYTVSVYLKDEMECLITSLGMNSIINVVERTGEVEFHGEMYNRNYPLWCVRWYDSKNKRSMKGVYIYKNNSMYFKIKQIERIDYKDDIYCFEMSNQNEPYFTLPNGLITHNCRLRNELSDNTFSFTLGAGGIATGSINVISMNANRFVQDVMKVTKDEELLHTKLKEQVEKIHKYQIAYYEIMKEFLDKGLLTIYEAGFISLKKQFLTLGVNGLVEAAEAWGLRAGNNDEYIGWMSRLLKVVFDTNKAGGKHYGVKFNTELVPAENLGVKNAKWDKKDGYLVSRECYNSYFYPVEDPEVNMLDKFVLHGMRIVKYLDGGSALHLNLEQYLTKEQYLHLFDIAGKCGTNYWTTNCLVTVCNDCGYIDKNKLKACSVCDSRNIDYATRVIGYLKKVSSFSLDRQIEEKYRFYHGKMR